MTQVSDENTSDGADAEKTKFSVSVIIPTCDRPWAYLKIAICSAANQSLRPKEIIVVDNGEFPVQPTELPEGVTIHRSKPRIGPSGARNIGANQSTGTHLAFLDDDDWWDLEFLQEASKTLHESSTRCVYGRILQSRNDILSEQENLTPETMTVSYLLRKNPGTGGINLLIEKRLFQQVGGFDEKLFVSEDRALALEVLLAGEKIGFAPTAIAIARQHDGVNLRNNNARKISFVLKYRRLMPISLFLRQFWKFGVRAHIRRIRKAAAGTQG